MLIARRHWQVSEEDALDDVFLTHYAGLVARAQQLLGRDRQAAEDLVHDAYVRLALCRFNVGAIDNVEGYLFTTLRNVHLSQVRRRQSNASATVSILDYESIVTGLRSLADLEERQRAYDALSHIVGYACVRKASSKAASVLILRFFHGYYSSEIARVVRTTEAGVAERLRMARAEARACLDDPSRLRSLGQRTVRLRLDPQAHDDRVSVRALRQAIFAARVGSCVPPSELDALYARDGAGVETGVERGTGTDSLGVAMLAHVVSCAACLDGVNRRLGLPLLADRDPSEKLGRGGGPANRVNRGNRAGRHAGRGASNLTGLLRMRVEETREDDPRQLRIAVNGLFVGSQAVSGAAVNEQQLKIHVAEQVGFVEVFDEYDTCLLYLNVEPPPFGPVEQSVRVPLSGARALSATIAFSDVPPTVRVVYGNPRAVTDQIPAVERDDDVADVVQPPASRWRLWPVSFRFVMAGLILGLLLANASQTLAAVDHVRRLVVDSISALIEKIRPHAVLPARPFMKPGSAVLLVPAFKGHAPIVTPPSVATSERTTDVDMSETAIAALRLLDDAGALTVEQVDIARGTDHRVHIEGVVANEVRREELLSRLRVLPARRVRVDLVSIDAASARRSPAPSTAITPGPLKFAELTTERVPAAHESVRRYLVARPAAVAGADVTEVTEAAVRRVESGLLTGALDARVQGRTLRDIVFTVSPADRPQLSPLALATWRDLIHRHAETFARQTRALRQEIEQVFPPGASDRGAALTAGADGADGDVWRIAQRLFDLASAHDVAIREAFSVATDGSESARAGTSEFRQSLLDAERLADALLDALPDASSR